jgi:hypothetical protein
MGFVLIKGVLKQSETCCVQLNAAYFLTTVIVTLAGYCFE